MVQDNVGSSRSYRSVFIIFGIAILAILGVGIFYVGRDPYIKITPKMPVIGQRTPISIELSEPRRGLTNIRIELIQGSKSTILSEKSFAPGSQIPFVGSKTIRDVIEVEAGRKNFHDLIGGTATIRVTAGRAGTWLRHPDARIDELVLPVRLTPPSIQITSAQTYVSQGGCEVVTYRVGESAVRDGVRAGSWWFEGYSLPGGGPQDRFAFFSVPYDMSAPNVRLVAEDAAGNAAETGFIDKFFPQAIRTDKIQVSDAFLNKVVPGILSQTPEFKERGSLLDSYLAINRELRQKNAAEILSLAQKSSSAFLWKEPFLVMPNSKVTAGFAERRTYLYQNREVDQQDHLGFDLAVTRQAPVPAANSGVVILARFFGIYGNAVMIDHGYGLQSIYGHLSSIAVKEGQKVVRGEIIGRTGETGLAGGDHLHFCTILQGLPVNPKEWSDSHWIQDRISRKLSAAFPFVK
jgi:murein DD-endopeptidase MepM/ murein hydrolase activator NlpD